GKEEYLNCEKYEIRHWDWTIENKITYLITKINEARKKHASLQQTNNIQFCHIENNNLIAFYKWSDDRSDETLTVISLDSHHAQQGFVQLPLSSLGFNAGHSFSLRDAITGNSYNWSTEWNYVELNPALPFHVFHINK
ncbi:MAG: starch synthase (maltosyl-transferring), partial [Candidatus Paceibacteria bacterium]